MNPMGLIMFLAQMANIVAGAGKTVKEQRYKDKTETAKKEQEKKQKRLSLRNALARTLGVKVLPHETGLVDMPEMQSTRLEDIISGVSRGVSAFGSQDVGKRMYSLRKRLSAPKQYPYEAL